MERKNDKGKYLVPEIKVISVNANQVLCTSPGSGFGSGISYMSRTILDNGDTLFE